MDAEHVLLVRLHLPVGAALGAWRGVAALVEALARTSARAGLVVSGEVLGELEERRPGELATLRGLVADGQVELVGAPLFDALLPLLPERDAVGQLAAHAAWLRRLFGVRPSGCLLEGPWEPTFPRIVVAAGLRWAAVPGTLLWAAGAEALDGVYRTEREGDGIAVLPLADAVRVVRDPDEVVAGGVLPSEVVDLGVDRGSVYLPAHGQPERHLVVHDLANRLHKRMIRVSRLVDRIDPDREGLDPSRLVQARRYLYRAQAPEPYAAPGAHDPAIRERAWRDLLRAEEVALAALDATDRLVVERTDQDCDGVDDVILRTPDSVLVLDPRGAVVTELSVPSLQRNLADVPGRPLLAERFLGAGDTVEALAARPEDARGLWQVVAAERHGADAVRAVLEREALIEAGGARHRVRIQKRFTLRDRTLGFRYELHARGGGTFRARHALELNLALGPDAFLRLEDLRHPLAAPADRGRVEHFRVEGGGLVVEVQLLQPARLWHHPIGGQGVCVLLVHEPAVEAGTQARFDLKVRISG